MISKMTLSMTLTQTGDFKKKQLCYYHLKENKEESESISNEAKVLQDDNFWQKCAKNSLRVCPDLIPPKCKNHCGREQERFLDPINPAWLTHLLNLNSNYFYFRLYFTNSVCEVTWNSSENIHLKIFNRFYLTTNNNQIYLKK
ncbi:hypothetical protein BpHYR1_009209 [Brachionus plicatilis]|uniref:Uncharacterized protein n=1 Tax=Brachionus plicatilis TaxID=10195 RepID=A0A3M7PTI9_BRAPC|nr:hypothetical protein BpHYR1_009209 [Brachionus plicatilis]